MNEIFSPGVCVYDKRVEFLPKTYFGMCEALSRNLTRHLNMYFLHVEFNTSSAYAG